MQAKPLFIPLKTEFFNAFKEGTKAAEYRLLGGRWNERQVYGGRRVILSKGYGKHERLTGIIGQVQLKLLSQLAAPLRESLHKIYDNLYHPRVDRMIICFDIRIDR